jgi:DNA (cytosine-5)-methyltransferase 1
MQINYIEGFAGIGGFRLGFEQACAETGVEPKCVFAFEKDKYAKQTYLANFGEEPAGDITKIPSKDIPGRKRKDDILFFFAGFPCQPWSTAGKQKGVNDERDMIPQVTRIILDKQPDVFVLENVKGLKSKKFKDVYDRLMWDLKVICGYTVYERIYNAKAVVPQNRQRIFIAGFKNQIDFEFPELPAIYPVSKDVLEFENVPEKYFLGESAKKWVFNYRERHTSSKNGGFSCRIAEIDESMPTLSSRYGSNKQILVPEISRWTPYYRVADLDEQANTITDQYGSNGGVATLIPELKQIGKINKGGQGQRIYDINGLSVMLGALSGGQGAKTGLYAVPEIKTIDGVKYLVNYSRVRRLMPRECARVMGFSDDFKIVVSDTQAYKQFGNAVVPAVVKEICKAVIRKLIFKDLK